MPILSRKMYFNFVLNSFCLTIFLTSAITTILSIDEIHVNVEEDIPNNGHWTVDCDEGYQELTSGFDCRDGVDLPDEYDYGQRGFWTDCDSTCKIKYQIQLEDISFAARVYQTDDELTSVSFDGMSWEFYKGEGWIDIVKSLDGETEVNIQMEHLSGNIFSVLDKIAINSDLPPLIPSSTTDYTTVLLTSTDQSTSTDLTPSTTENSLSTNQDGSSTFGSTFETTWDTTPATSFETSSPTSEATVETTYESTYETTLETTHDSTSIETTFGTTSEDTPLTTTIETTSGTTLETTYGTTSEDTSDTTTISLETTFGTTSEDTSETTTIETTSGTSLETIYATTYWDTSETTTLQATVETDGPSASTLETTVSTSSEASITSSAPIESTRGSRPVVPTSKPTMITPTATASTQGTFSTSPAPSSPSEWSKFFSGKWGIMLYSFLGALVTTFIIMLTARCICMRYGGGMRTHMKKKSDMEKLFSKRESGLNKSLDTQPNSNASQVRNPNPYSSAHRLANTGGYSFSNPDSMAFQDPYHRSNLRGTPSLALNRQPGSISNYYKSNGNQRSPY